MRKFDFAFDLLSSLYLLLSLSFSVRLIALNIARLILGSWLTPKSWGYMVVKRTDKTSVTDPGAVARLANYQLLHNHLFRSSSRLSTGAICAPSSRRLRRLRSTLASGTHAELS